LGQEDTQVVAQPGLLSWGEEAVVRHVAVQVIDPGGRERLLDDTPPPPGAQPGEDHRGLSPQELFPNKPSARSRWVAPEWGPTIGRGLAPRRGARARAHDSPSKR